MILRREERCWVDRQLEDGSDIVERKIIVDMKDRRLVFATPSTIMVVICRIISLLQNRKDSPPVYPQVQAGLRTKALLSIKRL